MYGKREIPAPFAPQKQKAKPQKTPPKQNSGGCSPAAVLLLLELLSQ
ncbi:hypothetical protein [Anaerotignum sp.]|nr:hypothetical protein [Anaerotignum sp.]MCI7658077.1 hypothetical protein [Clostridia bacterium]MDY5414321.1 hypothetical protein [Anaerotignum sp.]